LGSGAKVLYCPGTLVDMTWAHPLDKVAKPDYSEAKIVVAMVLIPTPYDLDPTI
jgi:hypothetical protein